MPPFTLKLGSVDLAPYLRVGNDEGFDPYDAGGFEEPAFIDNPFGEGQGLANVDSRNREMAWPLYLNATSKDALHDLVGDINREIRYATRPLRVEWKDQDATASTFFDVEYARFDPNFRMRPSARGWLAGTLRVWCKPYGHTGTYRTIGTAAQGIASFSLASLVGDAPAQFKVETTTPTFQFHPTHANGGLNGQRGLHTILAVTPTGWPAFVQASCPILASYSGDGATMIVASGALGSSAFRSQYGTEQQLHAYLRLPASAGFGGRRVRVLPLVRSSNAAGMAMTLYQTNAEAAFSQATLTAGSHYVVNRWQIVDAGVLGVPSEETLSGGAVSGFDVVLRLSGLTTSGTQTVDLNGVFLLPEDNALIVRDGHRRSTGPASGEQPPVLTVVDGGTGEARSHAQASSGEMPGGRDISFRAIGRAPEGSPVDVDEFLTVVSVNIVASSGLLRPSGGSIAVMALERFTFAR